MRAKLVFVIFLLVALLPPGARIHGQDSETKNQVNMVFYRPKRFTGSALTPSVYLNGEQLARLDNGRYFVARVAPGQYRIESSMKHDPLEIEARSGQVLFYEMVILEGNWRGGGRLIPTGNSAAREAINKLKPLDKQWVTSDKVSFLVPEETPVSAHPSEEQPEKPPGAR